MNAPPNDQTSPLMAHPEPTLQITAPLPPPPAFQGAAPDVLDSRLAKTLIGLFMVATLSLLTWWLLPLLTQFWQLCLDHLTAPLGLGGSTAQPATRIPAWLHLSELAIAAPVPVPGMNELGIQLLLATCSGLLAGLLRAPLRSSLRLLAGLHIVLALLCAAIPGSPPYSIEQHTRCLSLFSQALLLITPATMAFSHYIVEYDLERRMLATFLVALYLVLTLPVKLTVHALLIQAASGLTEPTLFLVFGPALDIFMVTAIYAWAVTWRHNPA